jgi:post-segregation antitoxin (ccd killing protein)
MTVATWRDTAPPNPGAIVPLTLAGDLAPPEDGPIAEARMLGVDAEAVFRAALARAIAEAKMRRWQEENRKAIEAHAEWVFRHGVPLGRPRAF